MATVRLKMESLVLVRTRQFTGEEPIIKSETLIFELDACSQNVEHAGNRDCCLKSTTLLAAIVASQVPHKVIGTGGVCDSINIDVFSNKFSDVVDTLLNYVMFLKVYNSKFFLVAQRGCCCVEHDAVITFERCVLHCSFDVGFVNVACNSGDKQNYLLFALLRHTRSMVLKN